MRRLLGPNTLLCFSPPVMVATIIIELGLAAWILTRYAISTKRRLIILILVCLAAFQLAEYYVCGSHPPDLIWSRLGYVFITALPPLGLHLILKFRGGRHTALLGAAYAAGLVFALAFAFLPTSLNGGVCTGNYVIFQLAKPLYIYYTIYYFGLVLLSLLFAIWPLKLSRKPQRLALRWIAIGYVAFTLPVFILNYLLPMTHQAIPSIMCGFAVIFAIVLGLRVAPLAHERS